MGRRQGQDSDTQRETFLGSRQQPRTFAEIVNVRSDFKAVEDDPEDDMVVNTALDGQADYIVSGDRHLRKLRRFRGVRIVSPSAFMAIVTKSFGDLILSKSDFE